MAKPELIDYPIARMIEKLTDIGFAHPSVIAELKAFETNGVDGSTIDSFMSAMVAYGDSELNDYIQVWPLVKEGTILFAHKDFLLAVVESDPLHLDNVLNDIGFRQLCGTMRTDIEKTSIDDLKNLIFASKWTVTVNKDSLTQNAQEAYWLEVNTVEDLFRCDYQDYYSTAIAWPITDAIEALLGDIGSEGYTYLATIDFIVDSLISKHQERFLEKCDIIRQAIHTAYAKQVAASYTASISTGDNVSTEFVNIYSFTEADVEQASVELGIKDEVSIIRKFVNLGDKEKFNGVDVMILHIAERTEEIALAMKMFDFRLDETQAGRYRLFHNNYQKLFLVAVDG